MHIFGATVDVKDCFHGLRIKPEMAEFFALPGVRASLVAVDRTF